jgi:hypothetical protein
LSLQLDKYLPAKDIYELNALSSRVHDLLPNASICRESAAFARLCGTAAHQ